jgi:hypothetical protein
MALTLLRPIYLVLAPGRPTHSEAAAGSCRPTRQRAPAVSRHRLCAGLRGALRPGSAAAGPRRAHGHAGEACAEAGARGAAARGGRQGAHRSQGQGQPCLWRDCGRRGRTLRLVLHGVSSPSSTQSRFLKGRVLLSVSMTCVALTRAPRMRSSCSVGGRRQRPPRRAAARPARWRRIPAGHALTR